MDPIRAKTVAELRDALDDFGDNQVIAFDREEGVLVVVSDVDEREIVGRIDIDIHG